MVRKIIAKLDKVHGSEHEGFFLDSSSYDEVIDEDVDVFDEEGNKLIVFRKGALTEEDLPSDGFEFFKKVATCSKNGNRGLAAGRELDWNMGNRTRLSTGQKNVITRGKGARGFSSFEEIEKVLSEGKDPSTFFWLSSYREGEFESFLDSLKSIPVEQWKKAFQDFTDNKVDTQARANHCYSNVFGSFGRTGRNPYCRLSVSTAKSPERYEELKPFYHKVDQLSREAFPEAHAHMKEGLKDTDPYYTLFGTAFTCITVNYNFRLASHFDGRNFDGAVATLTVFEKGDFEGHYLVFPEVRLAFNLRQGDTITGDNSALLHGNTAKVGDGERVSLVFFTRQDIADKCHSSVLDGLRKEFWQYARQNLSDIHGNGRKGWGGVWKGMYDSPEWYAFLEERGYSGELRESDKLTS